MFEGDNKVKNFLTDLMKQDPASPEFDWKKWGVIGGAALVVIGVFLGIGLIFSWKAMFVWLIIAIGGTSIYVALFRLQGGSKLEAPMGIGGLVLAVGGIIVGVVTSSSPSRAPEPSSYPVNYQSAYAQTKEVDESTGKKLEAPARSRQELFPEDPKPRVQAIAPKPAGPLTYRVFEEIPWPPKEIGGYKARFCECASDKSAFWVIVVTNEVGIRPAGFRVDAALRKKVEDWVSSIRFKNEDYYTYYDLVTNWVPRGTITAIHSDFWEGKDVDPEYQWWYVIDILLESGKFRRILADREMVEAIRISRASLMALPLPEYAANRVRRISEGDLQKMAGWSVPRRSVGNNLFLFVPLDGGKQFLFSGPRHPQDGGSLVFTGPFAEPYVWYDFGPLPSGKVVDSFALRNDKNGNGESYFFLTVEENGVRSRYRASKEMFEKLASIAEKSEAVPKAEEAPKPKVNESDF